MSKKAKKPVAKKSAKAAKKPAAGAQSAKNKKSKSQKDETIFRPMNVAVARGSKAEKYFLARAALPGVQAKRAKAKAGVHAAAIAPGFPATPGHNLINHGGKTIQDLIYTNFYIGGTSSWKQDDIDKIDKALAAAMSDSELNNVMMQYFNNKPITSTFRPSHILPGTKPAEFSQGDVEKLLKSLFQQGSLAGFDFASTVFNFLLPSGTVLTTETTTSAAVSPAGNAAAIPVETEESSLQGLGGYHGSIHVSGNTTVYYSIGVFSETRPDGRDNGIVSFDEPWKNIAATLYHELNEARTDPDVDDAIRAGNSPKATKFLGWTSRQGEECGDFPMTEAGPNLNLVMKEVNLSNGGGTVPVQFQYSNAVQGPEGPIASPHGLT
jgi:hypothetical protein